MMKSLLQWGSFLQAIKRDFNIILNLTDELKIQNKTKKIGILPSIVNYCASGTIATNILE